MTGWAEYARFTLGFILIYLYPQTEHLQSLYIHDIHH